MAKLEKHFQKDIEDIEQIPGITAILDIICNTTGMGFAAVARVTDDRWVTCSSHDNLNFGLKPGDELKIETTICNEIRQREQPVIIDHVKEDPLFHDHHTPAMYGFQSYISVPIVQRDGTFFGTLCAVDPQPRELKSSKALELFTLFSNLIAFHLSAIDNGRELEKEVAAKTAELTEKNASLEKMNRELEAFAYISSHDLQEPLRKIQTIATIIIEKESGNLSDSGKDYFKRMQNAAQRMQSLIRDLLAYSRTAISEKKYEITNLDDLLLDVKADLREELHDKSIRITAQTLGTACVIPFQIRQMLYNLISNSIKFAQPGIPAQITIRSKHGKHSDFKEVALPDGDYIMLEISDNGIGFDQSHNERIFNLFQRLHERDKIQGTGIGLAIVKKIVENHKGHITATGSHNKGACFTIYVPLLE